jgi:colanic acid/amylovoran biosynthesis glycosyltransferase
LSVGRLLANISELKARPDSPPVVAFYCATFLKPEMLHIYRQITGLRRVQPFVIAQKRENPVQFPFDKIEVVPKSRVHFLRRFWCRQVRERPWQISHAELDKLLRVLTENDAQALHIFFGHIAAHLLPLVRAWPRPSVVSFHGADAWVDMEKPAYRKQTKEVFDAVDRVFVRSESLRRTVADLGCAENKIDIVRTGIPLQEFPFRDRNFPTNGEWRFVQACRLIEKKGLATTLHAFTHFLTQYPDAKLTIAGEGPMLGELQELTRKLRIDNRVALPGFVSEEKLRGIFYASHIFLHPSETGRDGNQEGIPNSMLEAMASGLPVFATNHGGIPEAIENRVSGILVPESDYAALAVALLAAVQDRHILSCLACNGANTVRQKFDQQKQADRLEEIYLQATAASCAGT